MRFSIDQLKKLGTTHNDLIKNAFTAVIANKEDLTIENVAAEIKKNDIDLSPIKTTVEKVVDDTLKAAPSFTTFDIIKPDPQYFSSLSLDYLKQIDAAITSATDYDSTVKNLASVENTVLKDTKINDNDFNLLVGTLEIGKNASQLWYKDYNSVLAKGKPTVKSVVRADCIASSAYFTGIGLAAFFPAIGTPVTAAAFLGGWAISAAVGSAYHAIGLE